MILLLSMFLLIIYPACRIMKTKKTLFLFQKGMLRMNLAKLSSAGQITVPIDIRRILNLKAGDKVLFTQNENGEIVIGNASLNAIRKAQKAFEGVAEEYGFKDEDDVQRYIDEMRYGKSDNAL